MITCFGLSDGSVLVDIVGGVEPYEIVWSNGSEGIAGIENLEEGSYSYVVTDANECTTSGEAIVGEPEQLVVILEQVINQTDQSLGSIDISVVGGFGNYTYEWSNGFLTDDIADLISGNYTVTVTDENGCEAVLNVFVDIETTVFENPRNMLFVVFPNPASDQFSLRLNAAVESIEISTESGQKVFEQKDSTGLVGIDSRYWSSGIYYIRVISGDDVQVTKFMKD
jgi:hypothetical protein